MNLFRLGAIVLSLWSAATIHRAVSQVRFTVVASESLIDEPLRIVVGGLLPIAPLHCGPNQKPRIISGGEVK